jgi:hypothetical protein
VIDEPGAWWYFPPEDFSTFEGVGKSKHRKRCCSCNKLIDIGKLCLEFERERYPYTDKEEEICGNEIPMPSIYHCGCCGEIWLNLTALDYCPNPKDDMKECLKEYWEMTGFKPNSMEV